MRKISILFLLLINIFLCGCKNENFVSTDGSTSMELIMGFLSEAYYNQSGIRIGYNPTGSTSGILAVKEGRCDIGLSSRQLKKSETGLEATLLAYDAVAVVVNKSNSVLNLTSEQLNKVFLGEITNWSELGGEDLPVVLIGREANSGTRDAFETITDTVNRCRYTRVVTSSGDVIQTVFTNPNAIGYTSLASVSDKIKVLKIDGVEPNDTTVQNGNYRLKSSYYFVTRSNEPLSKQAKQFLDFALSDKAREYIIRAEAIPK